VKFFPPQRTILADPRQVHFDVVMTILADTLYTMAGEKLRGFTTATHPPSTPLSYGQGDYRARANRITSHLPASSPQPDPSRCPWSRLPTTLPWLVTPRSTLQFNKVAPDDLIVKWRLSLAKIGVQGHSQDLGEATASLLQPSLFPLN